MKISVVIPALDEAAELPATLLRARAVPEVAEIILSDGGSTDATRQIAEQAGAKVVTGARGRGHQLRAGASAASSEVVLLLHADTWLASGAGRAIAGALTDPEVVGGACSKAFRDPHWLMRGSRARCAWRMRVFQFAYGDQAIFVRRDVLERVGGIPAVPLMEEHELCRSLRGAGKLVLADTVVTTSARRFRDRGVLRTYWRMAMANLRWDLGVPPEAIRRAYERR